MMRCKSGATAMSTAMTCPPTGRTRPFPRPAILITHKATPTELGQSCMTSERQALLRRVGARTDIG